MNFFFIFFLWTWWITGFELLFTEFSLLLCQFLVLLNYSKQDREYLSLLLLWAVPLGKCRVALGASRRLLSLVGKLACLQPEDTQAFPYRSLGELIWRKFCRIWFGIFAPLLKREKKLSSKDCFRDRVSISVNLVALDLHLSNPLEVIA